MAVGFLFVERTEMTCRGRAVEGCVKEVTVGADEKGGWRWRKRRKKKKRRRKN